MGKYHSSLFYFYRSKKWKYPAMGLSKKWGNVYISFSQSVQCNKLAWFLFLKKIFHQTQGWKKWYVSIVLPEKKSLDKDKSIKMLTFSSQPRLPCFHVMNIQRMAVTNQKRLKLLTNQVVMHATQSTFSVLSLLPSCCIQALISEGRT